MITVTGATGNLGRLVVTGLLDAGVAPGEVTALVRDPARAADLADRGVAIAVADYDDPASLARALSGSDRVLLVSGRDIGKRVTQHAHVIAAARAADVQLLAYTSLPKADTSTLVLAPDNKATEALLADSGLPVVVLRNNWYWENYDTAITQAAATGVMIGSTHGGLTWPAAHADFAAAAVAVLTAGTVQPATIEVDGDHPFDRADLATEVARQTGREVVYTDLDTAAHTERLTAAGLPAAAAGFITAVDAGIATGQLDSGGHGISRLTGRPTRTMVDHVALVLAR